VRRAAASLVEAEKNFRRIMGYRDLWMLEAALREGGIEYKRVTINFPLPPGQAPPASSPTTWQYSLGNVSSIHPQE